ncbi:RNA-directed RNA polymerase L [Frankliniella fusca]|uniref:RNA-directed RNA polymerase L n=1 Tax=Frankliniella fusca TaxID=407009 RepID=A0AAE1H904_9NEOP|nr:RNA-directed RNA polymerase L [Frankliniella fusca]KAK3916598.1 RNA-directed RNA polymerase L [Frankliniella fusca]
MLRVGYLAGTTGWPSGLRQQTSDQRFAGSNPAPDILQQCYLFGVRIAKWVKASVSGLAPVLKQSRVYLVCGFESHPDIMHGFLKTRAVAARQGWGVLIGC